MTVCEENKRIRDSSKFGTRKFAAKKKKNSYQLLYNGTMVGKRNLSCSYIANISSAFSCQRSKFK